MLKNRFALFSGVAAIAVAAVLATASMAQQPGSAAPQPPAEAQQPAPRQQSQSPSFSAPNLLDDEDDDEDVVGQGMRDERQGRSAERNDDSQRRDYGERWRGRGGEDGSDSRRGWRDGQGFGPDWRERRGFGPGWREGRGREDDSSSQGSGMRFHGHGYGGGQGHGHGRMARLCGPNGERFVERMLWRLERVTQPTEQQRGAFDKLRQAADQARQKAQESCTDERAVTPPSRLAMMEKRLSTMLEAVRTIRPAMDEYWGSLSEDQKARFYAGQGWAERWRQRMWESQRPREFDRDGWRGGSGGRGGDGDFRGGWRDRDDRGSGRQGFPGGGGAWRDRDDDRGDSGPRRMRGPRDYDGDGWPNSWRGRS
jgi:hypothetical protein